MHVQSLQLQKATNSLRKNTSHDV